MLPFMGCVIERTSAGTKLTGASRDHMMAVALTPKLFRPPFIVKAVASRLLKNAIARKYLIPTS
jgi:hypothetical protein